MGIRRRPEASGTGKKARRRSRAPVFVPVAHTYYKLKAYTPKDKDEAGECDYNKKTIAVSRRMNDYGPWCATFWHEWLHGTFYENGFTSSADSEAIVESTAQAIMRMFSDPQGRRLLTDMLKHLEPK